MAVAVYSALVGVIFTVAFIYWGVRGSRRTRPGQIVKRLRASGGPVTIQVRAMGTTWKPSPSGRSDRLVGSARAVYTLDETGSVHLAWQGKRGAEQNFVGAVPESALAHAALSPQWILRRLIIGYVILLVVAFALGYSLAGGSIAKRLIVAVAALFAATLLVSIATTAIRVAISVRSVARDRTRSS